MTSSPPRSRLAALVAHPGFERATLLLILAAAVVVGVETSPSVVARHRDLLAAAHAIILGLFLGELAVRIAAYGRAWPRFFRSGWNLFDLTVVLLSCLPAVGPWATIARLARVLRVVRLVSASPRLRLIVGTMLRSIPSLGHVGLLLGLLLYVYGVMGVHLFATVDPAAWGSLPRAMLTLFQVLTLEGWVELQATAMAATPWAWVYFASFVLIAVFVVVNLFIAVVLANLDDARRAESDEPTMGDVLAEIAALRAAVTAQAAAPGASSPPPAHVEPAPPPSPAEPPQSKMSHHDRLRPP